MIDKNAGGNYIRIAEEKNAHPISIASGGSFMTRSLLRVLRVVFFILLAACLALTVVYALRCSREGQPFFGGDGQSQPVDEAQLAQSDDLCGGVQVAGIDLTGLTAQQAMDALKPLEEQALCDAYFVLETNEGMRTITYGDMRFTFNTAQLVQQALEGAQGNLDFTYQVDLSPLEEKLPLLAAEINCQPVDATVAVNTSYLNWFEYTQSQPGRTLDTQALYAQLEEMANQGQYGAVTLPVTYQEPAVTVEHLQANLVKRSEASTYYSKSPYNREDRVYNIKKAAGLINGMVLQPGEEFSANTVLGDRTYELGWKAAPAYVSGTTEDQAGGGVCQVSSTLYCAVVKADLEIVYRRNHSSPVGYVDRGLDATINTGTIDFQFRNNTAAPIYLFVYTIDSKDGSIPEGKTDQSVYVEIYGESLPLEEYDEIRLSSKKVETLYPSGDIEVIVDTTVAPNYVETKVERKNGSIYQSYKSYYKDGELVKTEDLAKSTYRAYSGKMVVGTGYLTSSGTGVVS